MKRRIFLITLLALALMGGLVWLALPPREPVYQGKTLSEWLEPGLNAPGTEEAIRHIGTNGIPTLLRMLRAHDSKLKLQLVELAQKQHLVKSHFIPASDRNYEAAGAFDVLGPAVSNAVAPKAFGATLG
jgi:hypothetical protein